MILQKLRKNKKGFTLVELIVVLVVLAILIGALTPTMIGFINEARGKALVAEARVGLLAAQMIVVESPAAATSTGTTGWLSSPSDESQGDAAQKAWAKKFNALTIDVTGTVAAGGGLGGKFTNVTLDTAGTHVTGITYERNNFQVVINPDGTVTVTPVTTTP